MGRDPIRSGSHDEAWRRCSFPLADSPFQSHPWKHLGSGIPAMHHQSRHAQECRGTPPPIPATSYIYFRWRLCSLSPFGRAAGDFPPNCCISELIWSRAFSRCQSTKLLSHLRRGAPPGARPPVIAVNKLTSSYIGTPPHISVHLLIYIYIGGNGKGSSGSRGGVVRCCASHRCCRRRISGCHTHSGTRIRRSVCGRDVPASSLQQH